jgi:hypothetical protein
MIAINQCKTRCKPEKPSRSVLMADLLRGDLLRGEQCEDSLRPPPSGDRTISHRLPTVLRAADHRKQHSGRQDRWIVVEIAARTVSFGFGLLQT